MSVFMSRELVVPVTGKKLSDYAIGESVFLNIDGVATEFLVVQQGNPDTSMYDASCDGTWLLMKDVYTNIMWDNDDNDYKNSNIHNYLNNTFLNLFDSDVKAQIKTVKIPYVNGTGEDGYSGSIAHGANGLSTKIFLLSGYEVGFTQSNDYFFPIDGTKLSYFVSSSLRIAYLSGTETSWWLRSPDIGNDRYAWYVTPGGYYSDNPAYSAYGVRPTLILPFDVEFNSKTNELKA